MPHSLIRALIRTPIPPLAALALAALPGLAQEPAPTPPAPEDAPEIEPEVPPELEPAPEVAPAAVSDVWAIAYEFCILPFEEVSLPDMSGVEPTDDTPDWFHGLAEGTAWAVGDGIFLSLAGTPADELATCLVETRDPDGAVSDDYAAWAEAQLSAGRYVPAFPPETAHLASTIWREPRMHVRIETDEVTGAVRIFVREVPEEA